MQFTVYKSSAGSGKTFTLVAEYLKIALGSDKPDTYRHILAITFTNKAANEMKERVLQALKDLSGSAELQGTSVHLKTKLLEETGMTEAQLAERSNRVLEHILHHYADFSISTIDKFVHRVVRAFAFDLNIPVNFDVEVEEEQLLEQAIDLLIEQVGSEEALTELLIDFTEKKTDSDKGWSIEGDIGKVAKSLFKESSIAPIEQLRQLNLDDFGRIKDALNAAISEFEDKLVVQGKAALDTMKGAGVEVEHLYRGSQGLGKYFENLATLNEIIFKGPNSYVVATAEEDKWYAGKTKPAEKEAIDSIADQLLDYYYEAKATIEEGLPQYRFYRLLLQNIHSLAVLTEIESLMTELKEEGNIVHISEFNRRVAEIVLREPVPFIYERLGERYQHYLIDEFQDTSTMQWHNLLPLLDNSLSNGHFNMVVGDGKQAIYRFRGGEVEQLAQLPAVKGQDSNEHIRDRAATLQRHMKEQPLDTNWRSKAEIVAFNNELFSAMAEALPPELAAIYDKHAQVFDPQNTGGMVLVEQYTKPAEHNDVAYNDWSTERVTQYVHQALEDGYALSDIAIISRGNDRASALAGHLIGLGIAVVSQESLLLNSSPKVRFLAATMHFLKDQRSKRSQTLMLNFLIESKRITADLHDTLFTMLDKEQSFNLSDFLQSKGFAFFPYSLRQTPLYELSEQLIQLFNMAEVPDPFLTFFLEHVQEFASTHINSLSDFLEWWDEHSSKLSIQIPEGIDAVTIMTIHKSKGLQFPVVIVPNANWDTGGRDNQMWVQLEEERLANFGVALVPAKSELSETTYAEQYKQESDRELLDSMNLLYVAFTRPQSRLYVTTNGQKIGAQFMPTLMNADGWNEEAGFFQRGIRAPYTRQQAEHEDSLQLNSMIMGDWRDRLAISLQASKVWGDEAEKKDELPPQLIKYALCELTTADQVDALVERMHIQGLASDEEARLLSTKLAKLLHNSAVAAFFSADKHSVAGREILFDSNSSIKPDRIVLDDDRVQLIGIQIGANVRPVIEALEFQENALRKMGHLFVDKVIINPINETVTPLWIVRETD